MKLKPETHESLGEKAVKDIRRATRKQCAAEEQIKIVSDGLKCEDITVVLCPKPLLQLVKTVP